MCVCLTFFILFYFIIIILFYNLIERIFLVLNITTLHNYAMSYRTIAVKDEIYNLIKERARNGFRGISNQLELEIKGHNQSNFSSDKKVFVLEGELGN